MPARDDQHNLTVTAGAGHDWEDEAFAAFALEDSGDEEDTLSDLVANSEELRNALAGLQSGPESPPAQPHDANDIAPASPEPGSIRPATLGSIDNPELAEAFLQDASRGVASLEQAIINYESQSDPEQAIGQICRELHTLKGAAGTVGLEDVGRYLHEVEAFVQRPEETAATHITETLLACVDTVRRQVEALAGSPDSATDTSTDTASFGRADTQHSEAEDAVSVKGSQLDRLMDMLTALVMLRNRRESRVEQLREVNQELSRCGARLRELERQLCSPSAHTSLPGGPASSSDPLIELANDMNEISRTLRESYEPVADENLAVSNFIRQFRHALVKLLRMPVSGLFRRLQRAALDAARVEGKKIRLEVVGADVGLERSVQERLFDPLLHIVRNAVSHGIEVEEDRQKLGKAPYGTITLQATGTPNMLVLTVRDDGRGLDYEALRRRGVELGILTGDRKATPQELAQLIFRRGFSTRETANEIAGRGIGMDVVADTLDRMHAWVEVESEPGLGTSVTLTVPLRSIIEHTMIVRAGQQLFAIPMQYIKNAGDPATQLECDAEQRLARVLGIERVRTEVAVATHIVVEAQPLLSGEASPADEPRTIATQAAPRVKIEVDQIVGPEEVVVRPLPPLFRHQQLFAGVTLSGNGEIVLMLDARMLVEVTSCYPKHSEHGLATDEPVGRAAVRRVLVVDDSLSARRAVAVLCRKQGWHVSEAVDGAVALDLLSKETFEAVITDFDMPQMNGLQLTEAIRTEAAYADLPVFMLSSRAREDMEERALAAGARSYLQKPITEAKLEEVLSVASADFPKE